MSHKIWAVVLAAGESKRMGQPKMLLPFGEKTIIESVLAAVMESEIEDLLVVLGADQERIVEKIRGLPIETVFNPDYKEGMLSSVRAGFNALPLNAAAALVLLGDQPFISPLVINQVREAFLGSDKSIGIPVFKGRRGHPVAIDIKYRDEIRCLKPDIGLRQLLHDHPDEILEVMIEDGQILQDIDDVQDYQNAVKHHNKRLD